MPKVWQSNQRRRSYGRTTPTSFDEAMKTHAGKRVSHICHFEYLASRGMCRWMGPNSGCVAGFDFVQIALARNRPKLTSAQDVVPRLQQTSYTATPSSARSPVEQAPSL